MIHEILNNEIGAVEYVSWLIQACVHLMVRISLVMVVRIIMPFTNKACAACFLGLQPGAADI